jgi:hypothetical protein
MSATNGSTTTYRAVVHGTPKGTVVRFQGVHELEWGKKSYNFIFTNLKRNMAVHAILKAGKERKLFVASRLQKYSLTSINLTLFHAFKYISLKRGQ